MQTSWPPFQTNNPSEEGAMSIHNRLDRLAFDRRLRRAGDDCASLDITPIPLSVGAKRRAEVRVILEEQAAAVRGAEESGPSERARIIGYLAGIALKAIEAGNLAARIEMLEAVLKQRNGAGKA